MSNNIKKYGNKRAAEKIEKIKQLSSLKNDSDLITTRCKFNFHYFDNSNAGQDFKDWDKKQLVNLFEKLKTFSASSLKDWKGEVNLIIYGKFPISAKTDFEEPEHIPIEAQWGRFRLGSKIRLIGFTIPSDYRDREHHKTNLRWDINTFYVVFLDRDHKFWKTERD